MRTRSLLFVALVCVVVVAATACSGDEGGDDASGHAGDAAPFVGTNWVLTDGSRLGMPLGSVTVTATFTADTVSGSSGCNTYRAPIARDDQKVEVTGAIAVTQMACTGPADAVERAYLMLLPDVRTYAISGEHLTLRDLDGKALLDYRAASARDILGDWVATSYYTGTAIQSVAVGTTVTATFTEESVSGNGGCNRYHGPASVARTTIRLGPFAGTLKACVDPAGTQEQQYLAALELARTYEIAGDRLTLFRSGGTIAATFDRA